MMKKALIAVSISLLLGGCGDATNSSGSEKAGSVIKQSSVSEQLDTIYNDYFEQNLKLNPLLATYIGDKRYNDQLPNYLSKQHIAKQRDLNQRFLEKISGINVEQLSRSFAC